MENPSQQMTIRPACLEEVELLDRHIPVGSPTGHQDRVRSHNAGEADYLIAWLDDIPAGHVIVRWSGFRFGFLPKRFPGIPVLLKLRVWPPARWSTGIGTALVTAAEQTALARGREGIGLGVEIDNERALRLYERLGYVDWGGGTLCERVTRFDADGNEVPYDEFFTVLTKRIIGRAVGDVTGGDPKGFSPRL